MAQKNITILEEETTLEGELSFSSPVVIKGRFTGTIDSQGNISVAPSGVVEAEIKADNITIAGRVTGNCYAREKIELCNTANLKGNIKSQKIKIADNAAFDGNCEMTK
ncbi:MAG TPA: polymer-forming cytoskeletal protein [Spirochaetota bacterium]|nr:polymer-forming cytoskeletal protein [Spirochaetota bacterium]